MPIDWAPMRGRFVEGLGRSRALGSGRRDPEWVRWRGRSHSRLDRAKRRPRSARGSMQTVCTPSGNVCEAQESLL